MLELTIEVLSKSVKGLCLMVILGNTTNPLWKFFWRLLLRFATCNLTAPSGETLKVQLQTTQTNYQEAQGVKLKPQTRKQYFVSENHNKYGYYYRSNLQIDTEMKKREQEQSHASFKHEDGSQRTVFCVNRCKMRQYPYGWLSNANGETILYTRGYPCTLIVLTPYRSAALLGLAGEFLPMLQQKPTERSG